MLRSLFSKLVFILIIITNLHFSATCQVREIMEAIKPGKPFDGIPILQKKSHVIQAGVGLGTNVLSVLNLAGVAGVLGVNNTTTGKLGPFFLNYEYFIKDNLGLGIGVSYAEGTQTLSANSSIIAGIDFGTKAVTTNVKATTILLSTSYHLYTTDRLDPYTKISIGATIWKGKSTKSDGSDAGTIPTFPTPIAYNALVGLRYFAMPTLGLFGELSYSNLKFSANAGVAFKIH